VLVQQAKKANGVFAIRNGIVIELNLKVTKETISMPGQQVGPTVRYRRLLHILPRYNL